MPEARKGIFRNDVSLKNRRENLFKTMKLRETFVSLEHVTLAKTLLFYHSVVSTLLRWRYRIEAEVPAEMATLSKGRYLIVANHRRKIDPLIILTTLPRSIYRQFLPIRFFTDNSYLESRWSHLVLWSAGCFRAYAVAGMPSGVTGGLFFSDRGQTLFIFPEGRCAPENELVSPKYGIAYLSQQRDFTIFPVHVRYEESAGRRTAHVTWGKPFVLDDKTKRLETAHLAKYLFGLVQDLSARLE